MPQSLESLESKRGPTPRETGYYKDSSGEFKLF